jgi:hypothetical protein
LKAGLPQDGEHAQGTQETDTTDAASFPIRRSEAAPHVLGENAALSIAGTKLVLSGLSQGFDVLDRAAAEELAQRARGSEDYREGQKAFAEKRKPNLTGRQARADSGLARRPPDGEVGADAMRPRHRSADAGPPRRPGRFLCKRLDLHPTDPSQLGLRNPRMAAISAGRW